MLTGKYEMDDIRWFEAELILDGDCDLALQVLFTLAYHAPFTAVIKLSEIPADVLNWESFQDYLEERFVRPRLEELRKKSKDLWRVDLPEASNITMVVRRRPASEESSPAQGSEKPPIDYKKAFDALTSKLHRYFEQDQRFAMQELQVDILSKRDPHKSSYIFAEKAKEYYMLLEKVPGKEWMQKSIPPNVAYVEECMRELIKKKREVNARSVQELYMKKFPDEQLGERSFSAIDHPLLRS